MTCPNLSDFESKNILNKYMASFGYSLSEEDFSNLKNNKNEFLSSLDEDKKNAILASYYHYDLNGGQFRNFETSLPDNLIKDELKNEEYQFIEESNNINFSLLKYSKDIDIKSKSKNIKKFKKLVEFITNLNNVKIEILNSEEIRLRFNSKLSKQRAFIKDEIVYINYDYASVGDAIHELGHLYIPIIQKENIGLWKSIHQELLNHPLRNRLAFIYPELNSEQLSEELFATLLGNAVDDKIEASLSTRIKNYINNFINALSSFFGFEITLITTVDDIINNITSNLEKKAFLTSNYYKYTEAQLDDLIDYYYKNNILTKNCE